MYCSPYCPYMMFKFSYKKYIYLVINDMNDKNDIKKLVEIFNSE